MLILESFPVAFRCSAKCCRCYQQWCQCVYSCPVHKHVYTGFVHVNNPHRPGFDPVIQAPHAANSGRKTSRLKTRNASRGVLFTCSTGSWLATPLPFYTPLPHFSIPARPQARPLTGGWNIVHWGSMRPWVKCQLRPCDVSGCEGVVMAIDPLCA